MASQPPPPPQGIGRGGRGALLLAAMQNQVRRPGELQTPDPSREGGDAPAPAMPMGRGAILRQMMAQAKSPEPEEFSPISTPSPSPSMGRGALLAALQASGASKPMGRGVLPPMGRATILATTGLGSVASGLTTVQKSELEFSRPYKPSYPIPIQEMEELQIGQHSGKIGSDVDLEVNYIKLKVKKGMGVFEYHVSYEPQVDSRDMRFKLLSQPQVKAIIGQIKSFDGAKLYLPILLPQEITSVDVTQPNDQSHIILSIKYTGQNQGMGRIQLYNILFRKIMNVLKMTQIGRNFFDPRGGIPVPQHKLQVWPGYVHAIQDFEGGLMLNCDASFRVLRTATAKDLLYDAYQQSRENFQDLFVKQIIGCIVLTRYNNKTYRIDDIAWDVSPESTFSSHTGKEISYLDYYQNAYSISIDDKKQPLLIHKPKRKANELEDKVICLVPELCSMTGLTDAMRNDFKVMKDIAAHTRVTPNQRQAALKKFCENLNTTAEAKQVLDNWGLKLDLDTLKINGRIMNAEKIILSDRYSFMVNKEADWGRELSRSSVLRPVDIENWLVLCTKRELGKAQEFVNCMVNMGPQMGIQVKSPNLIALDNDRTETYLRFARDKVHPGIQLVVFIFPTSRDDRYAAIKKLCCVEMPVPSQVINSRTISQPQKLRSVTQKIALQINCKLGGELWSLPIPLKSAMVCGVDAYHDPSRAGRSVLGFVASLNAIFTRWFSITNFQERGQELGDCLKIALLAALRKYNEVNHSLPSHIIFYRDGVGDGQMKHVGEYEVQQLESCFGNFAENYSPKLTFIVVQKKINTKIFLRLNKDGRQGGLENPPPGTVLDHTITRKNWFDFFLVSQHVRQGTVNPTHYVVVHNRSELAPDHIQKLSYKLTHLYYNWPGTIRVPAPCQYAHKLAYLCGQSIHREPSAALCDKLFFL